MHDIPERVAAVHDRVRRACICAGREPESVTVLAASKTRTADEVRAAFRAGITDFGENYVAELLEKSAAVPEASWHFIGHLQRNKVKRAVPAMRLLHSLGSARLADALQHQEQQHEQQHARRPLDVLIQVNIGGEVSKSGVHEAGALDLARHVEAACPALSLRGLMTIPPLEGDPSPWFVRMGALRAELEDALGRDLPELSMGMSADLESAIAHGATIVRIGTALFGPRGLGART